MLQLVTLTFFVCNTNTDWIICHQCILSSSKCTKSTFGWQSPRTPLEELTMLPPDSLVGWRGDTQSSYPPLDSISAPRTVSQISVIDLWLPQLDPYASTSALQYMENLQPQNWLKQQQSLNQHPTRQALKAVHSSNAKIYRFTSVEWKDNERLAVAYRSRRSRTERTSLENSNSITCFFFKSSHISTAKYKQILFSEFKWQFDAIKHLWSYDLMVLYKSIIIITTIIIIIIIIIVNSSTQTLCIFCPNCWQ